MGNSVMRRFAFASTFELPQTLLRLPRHSPGEGGNQFTIRLEFTRRGGHSKFDLAADNRQCSDWRMLKLFQQRCC